MTSNAAHPMTIQVLHLDDDPFELERVRRSLEENPIGCAYLVRSVSRSQDFEKLLREKTPDVALLDIHLEKEDTDGIDIASRLKEISPDTVVLMFSTADDAPTISSCLSSGADDFLSKQSDKGELSLRILNSYKLARLKRGNEEPRRSRATKKKSQYAGLTMQRIAKRIPLIIDSAVTAVHVLGESGTGKEVVADIFEEAMPEHTPVIKVNCGAISPTLLESELFGHVKGSFTGAQSDKKGIFEAADGGWVFLDEVATLTPSAQIALLRVLDNGEVTRVGSTKPIAVRVRVISATNESLEELVKVGRFRKDLWQRLRETEVILPPIRERPEEIKELVNYFCKTMQGGPYEVSDPAMNVLMSASWQEGNVRELRNCLRAMTEMHIDKRLTPLGIPARVWDDIGEKSDEPPMGRASAPPKKAKDSQKVLNVPVNLSDPLSFDTLADLLLIELTNNLFIAHGKLSLRGLSSMIGMSRSTLSGRLKSVVQKNLIELKDLSQWVGISEK